MAPDIVITEEMIDAGIDVLIDYDIGAMGADEAIRAIFLKMVEAQK